MNAMTTTQADRTAMSSLPPSGWRNAILDALCLTMPDVFYRRGRRPIPLAVGIRDALCRAEYTQILASITGLSAKRLRAGAISFALGKYTSATWYLAAVAEGGPRYGLDGQPVDYVTDHERKGAKALLKKRRREARIKVEQVTP
jgi:sRNA-binding protein